MMYRLKSIFVLLLLVALFSSGCSTEKPAKQSNEVVKQTESTAQKETIEVTISAAASLEDAFKEIKPLFEQEHKHIKLFFNFGGSGALQKQILQGAPVDLFFSAAEDKYDELVEQGIVHKEQGKDMLQNTLVLIIPKESTFQIERFKDLANLDKEKLALGTPDVVPAGNYGKQTLEHLGLWEKVESNIVFAKDVRQVLTYVETGNVATGLVYKTDALTTDKVKVVAEADSNSHDPIVYPVGIIKNTKHMEESELFYQFLQSDVAKKIFIKYGFTVLD